MVMGLRDLANPVEGLRYSPASRESVVVLEMNAHLPQSYQTMEEIKQLCGVPTQIISARECKPIISVVQDVALGVYRMTKAHVRLSEKNMFNILATNQRFNGIAPEPFINSNKIKAWTGRQVLSTIIPKIINVEMRSNAYDENKSREENVDNIISIKNGEILSGLFDKDVYQARTKGLVHSIYNECGPDETRQFFDNTQKYICNFLVLDGFSVGVSDLITDMKTQKDFKEAIQKMKVDVYNTINQVHAGTLENNTTKNNQENFELKINGILNEANKKVGDTGMQRIDANANRLLNMIKSKSKGNNINVAQMIGCVGQVNIEGRRIANGYDDRTLPHYAKYDDGPDSRGFVENSFITGLTPQEFFFHAMGGREGLIDTAVGTSETGYIQRKLVKAMEDCKVNFDGSVRNASGAIVQFLYGDDGMDASKVESQAIPYFDMEIEKMLFDYQFSDDLKNEEMFMDAKLIKQLKADKAWRETHNKHVQQLLEDKEYLIIKVLKCRNESSVMYPISFMRIINNTAGMHERYGSNMVSDLDPSYALEEIGKLEEELLVNPHHKGTHLFQILLRAYMSPKRLIMRYRMCKEAFDAIIAQVKYRFHESLAHPSEMVGVVAAQSLGEPATQLTLNSVAYDTELLLNMDGTYKRVKIGEYIDQIIANPYKLEEHPNDTKLAWLNDKVTILSCDEEGKISWKRVEAVTRHPVINKDGTNTVLKVTTKSGREVIATKAKSFLKRVDNKIIQVDGEELRVGDHLPVSMIVPFEDEDQNIKLLEIDDPTGYIPNVKLSSGEITIKLSELEDYIDKVATNNKDVEILNNIKKEQIFYDEVVNIQEITNSTPWVYDLTVEETRNFNIYNGLAMADKGMSLTFHSAGISSASKTVRGVPRLKELLGVSKNMKTPSMKIYFKDEIAKNKNKCNELMHDIRTVRFKDIVTSSKIYFDPDDFDTNITDDREFIGIYKEFMLDNRTTDLSPWLLRIEFDKKKMHQYHVDMIHVHQTLLDFYTEETVQCLFSDDNADKLVFRIKMVITDASADDKLTELKALEHNIIENIIIKGVKKVERVSMIKENGLRYSPSHKKFVKQDECLVITDGTNLREILALDQVDGVRTITNDINEIYDTLGVEAARMALYNEICDVLDMVYVNYRHIALLIDVMTNKGNIMPTDRHGINRGDIGPLAKCSFEETTDKLIKAGIFGEYDKINGVSANIMLGQIAPCGTGDTDVLIDHEKLKKVKFEVVEDDETPDDACLEEAFIMGYEVPDIKAITAKTDNDLEVME